MNTTIFKKILSRLILAFIGITVAILAIVSITTKHLITEELTSSGQAIAQTIADSAAIELATMDVSIFQDLIINYTQQDSIQYVMITNKQFEILIDSFVPQIPEPVLKQLNTPDPTIVSPLPAITAIQVSHPILNGHLGHVFVGMNTDIIWAHLKSILPIILLAIPLIMAFTLWILNRVIKGITQPLKTLSTFTKDVERYQFDITKTNTTEIKQVTALTDEIGGFATNYLTLLHELETHIQQLTETSAKNAEIKKELTIAHDIQMNLLNPNPELHHNDNVSICASITPAKDVGGDFYDVIEKGTTIYVTIGDVSGKGVAAALVMAATLTSLRTTINHYDDPTDIITTVNKQISQYNPNMMFITVFFAAIDTQTGIIHYINAGHPSPLILADKIESLPSTKGTVLGINEHQYYPAKRHQLPANCQLLLTTDGVTEAHNASNELFGDDQLIAALNDAPTPSPAATIKAVTNALDHFVGDTPAHDDITMLSMSISTTKKEMQNPLVISFQNDINELIKLQHVTDIFAKHHDLASKDQKSINLVMEELLSNTIFYGYKDNAPHTIFVSFNHQDNEVIIDIEDDASAFNPLTDAPEIDTSNTITDQPVGGLGIHIVKRMVTDIHYHRSDDDKNKLKIIKELS